MVSSLAEMTVASWDVRYRCECCASASVRHGAAAMVHRDCYRHGGRSSVVCSVCIQPVALSPSATTSQVSAV